MPGGNSGKTCSGRTGICTCSDKNNALRHIDLGQITSSATTPSDGIVGLYLRELRRNDEITEGVSPLASWSSIGPRR